MSVPNPAWCSRGHTRTGLVTNQDPDAPHNEGEPLVIASVCSRDRCQAKAVKHVAGKTNRRAAYYSDKARREAREAREAQEAQA